MSLADAFRDFLSSLAPEQRHNLNLRSCEACSFHKVLNRTHFCTQVQPASTINNVYDAQLCIYYTPETATTGQITQTERETQKSYLDFIKHVGTLDDSRQYCVKNGCFETGTLAGWYASNLNTPIKIVSNPVDIDSAFACKIPYGEYVLQGLDGRYADSLFFALSVCPSHSDAQIFEVDLVFMDSTVETQYFSPTAGAYNPILIRSYAHNRLRYIMLKCNSASPDRYIVADQVRGFIEKTLTQREDLLVESKTAWVFASAASQNIIANTAQQKIKVYALDYLNNNADMRTEFEATIGGAQKYWGTRATKGIFAQTFAHPIICDVNTAFKFKTGGAVTLEAVHVQYVKEA